MTGSDGPVRETHLHQTIQGRIDRVCDQFEEQWRAGQSPSIESFLSGWEGADRANLETELKAVQDELERGLHDTYPTAGQESVSMRPGGAIGGSSQLPEVFGRYRIEQTLGAGGMGEVYLAEDSQLHRKVALKVPRLTSLDEEAISRFFREARAAAALQHPNICSVFDLGDIDGQYYISMAYIEGQSLRDIMKSGQQFNDQQAALLVLKLARALSEAHALGIVHRDLKPANIMFDARGEPVIMDFGLARMASADESWQTQAGQTLGTPAYMPPEQIEGDIARTGPASDIYSLGVILYELLAGELPFQGTPTKVMTDILLKEPPALSEKVTAADPRLVAICQRMMAKQLDDRYQAMTDVVADLEQIVAHDEASTTFVRDHSLTARIPSGENAAESENRGNPTLAPPAQQERSKLARRAGWHIVPPAVRLALIGGLGGIVLFAAIILLLPHGNGTIRIEINDPSIEVAVSGDNRYRIKGKDGQFEIEPGAHTLKIMAGGTTFETKEFTVGKGEQVELRVTLLEGVTVQVTKGGAAFDEQNIGEDSFPGVNQFVLGFDGIDDYVDLPLAAPTHSQMTFEAWVQIDTRAHPKNSLYIISNADGGGVSLKRHGSKWNFTVGYTTPDVRNTYVPTNSEDLAETGVWTHVAGVIDGRDVRLFVDGKKAASATADATVSVLDFKTPLVLGAKPDNIASSGFFEGRIGHVRISKNGRYKADFSPLRNFDSDADTLALYRFDEGSGTDSKDSSGNGHDGKIVGAKWVRLGGSEYMPDPDRAIAERVLMSGGGVLVTYTDSGGRDQRKNCRNLDDLPKFPFRLTRLSSNSVTDDDLVGLEHLEWFEDINFRGNSNITDATLERIGKLNGRNLWLEYTSVTDQGLAHLSNVTGLRSLALSGTAITDEGLSHLAAWEELQQLNLRATSITDDQLEHLGRLGNLKSLNLSSTSVTDEGLKHLSGLTNLQGLRLDGTKIVGHGLLHLTGLVALETIALSCPDTTDIALRHLRELPNLRFLFLKSADVPQAAFDVLKDFSNLEYLNIRRSSLTEDGAQAIAEVEMLDRLTLEGSPANLEPKALQHLSNISGLSFHYSLASRTQDIDAVLDHIKPLSNLRTLRITFAQHLKDSHLKHFSEMQHLELLELNDCQELTLDAVARLKEAMPKCKIVSDVGTFE